MFRFLCILSSIIVLSVCGCDKKQVKEEPSVICSENILRINLGQDVQTLDPRLARDQVSKCVLNMLYDGLTRLDTETNPQLSIAEDVDISEDGHVYTFKLREAYWSNGELVVAQDFQYAWNKILEPTFPANCASQLYVIKNARAAKEGKIPLEEVGIKVVDDRTLEVTLATPISYFFDILASSAFFPICRSIDENDSTWTTDPVGRYVSNGPFRFSKWDNEDYVEVVRNPTYWDSSSVNLERIVIMTVDSDTEAEMFANDELDWIGNGFTSMPLQSFYTLVEKEEVSTPSSMAMYWVRFNNEKEPFSNPKLLKAFGQAIDRKLVLDDVVANKMQKTETEENVDIMVAKKLFEEANVGSEKLSNINMIYQTGIRNKKIAEEIKKQLKTALNIDITIEEFSPLAYDEKIQKGEFSITAGLRPVDVTNDGESTMNQPLLVDDMSIVPVYYYTVSHAKKGSVHNLAESEEGSPDFKWVSVE